MNIAVPLLLLTIPLAGQDPDGGLLTENPLDGIRDELIRVLNDAGLPFSEAQANSITFVLEESRRASEQLFGDVMNFSGGPPQGEQLDRALAGIDWINDDFSQRVRDFLTPAQLIAWGEHIELRDAAVETSAGTAGTSQQVQQIRVNRNPFTSENQFSGNASSGGSYGFSSGGGVQAQIINRGGTGAWHGSYQFQLKDEALDARNPFASNKPSYQQRNINLTTSGPLIPNRLTLGARFNQSMQDNAATVNAETLDGPVRIGFTRPLVFRNGGVNGTLQLAGTQSVEFNYNRQRFDAKKQGMGGFSLPERAIDYIGGNDNFNVRHLWFASERLVQDISFGANRNHQESMPVTDGASIEVLGAFNGGSGQNRARSDNSSFFMNSLWIHSGDRLTVRTGGSLTRPRTNERSENNFGGTFKFASLDEYRIGRPITFTQTQGDPVLVNSQTEWNAFVQNEVELNDRITLFLGMRYENQTNLNDNNNFDPRLGIAIALDNSTVVRAGTGVFRMRVNNGIENTLAKLDGERQVEVVINEPGYPDPFQTGDVEIVPPKSRRVRADDLVAPYSVNTSFQIERSFPRNLFLTASYDFHRAFHLLRSRDINAPSPGEVTRPIPSEGNIWRLESTATSTFKALRITMRQRFSIFNLSANYAREVEGDVITNFGAPTDNFNLQGDYAETTRHRVNATINSRLFWDVYLTTNVSYSNGSPYTITTGQDDNGDGITNDRPEGVGRNTERGPHQGDVSFNLSKAFPIGGGGRGGSPNLNFFANFSNAFNRTNLGTPIGIRTSPFFGRSISASNPRQITVGMRFQF